MKLLSVKDEIRNITVTDSRYDEKALHFLDDKTDAEARKIAMRYFPDKSTVHMKKFKNDNAYLIYTDTDIKYGNARQCQGVMIQFDLLDGIICDVNFITADLEKMKDIKSALQFDLHRAHFSEQNVESLKKDAMFNDPAMVKMFKELGEEFGIAELDSDVFYKNQYLLLEKGRLQSGILFDLYRDIKDLTHDENTHMDKSGRCVTFALNGQHKRVNVIGGNMPEMDGYIYFTKERMLSHIKNVMKGKQVPPPVLYNGVEFELKKYSNSKKLEDLIDPRFKSNYLESLIQYNMQYSKDDKDDQEQADER